MFSSVFGSLLVTHESTIKRLLQLIIIRMTHSVRPITAADMLLMHSRRFEKGYPDSSTVTDPNASDPFTLQHQTCVFPASSGHLITRETEFERAVQK